MNKGTMWFFIICFCLLVWMAIVKGAEYLLT